MPETPGSRERKHVATRAWLHTKLKYNRKSLFNRFTIIPQQEKKYVKTKTKKVKRVVLNRYSLVDISNHTAGVEDRAWKVFFIEVSIDRDSLFG